MAAASSILVTQNRYQDRRKAEFKHLADAIAGGTVAAQKSLDVVILGLPDFEVTCLTDTNTATSPVLNLTDLLVPFSTPETQRVIKLRVFTSDDNDSGYTEVVALVRGHGTTPVIDASVVDVNGAIGAEAATVAVQSNKVVVNTLGIQDVDIRWLIHVFVGDQVNVPFIPTT